jgi:DNA-binding MarR family transcriptional regulator
MAGRIRDEALNQALELMYFGFRGLVDAPDRALARRGLGRMHHRVLYFIAREPGVSVGDLLARLAITKQALHRPLRDLLARRLVTTNADRNDRRVKRLVLSRKGAALERRLSGMQRAHLEAIFSGAGRAAESGWRSVMKLMSS